MPRCKATQQHNIASAPSSLGCLQFPSFGTLFGLVWVRLVLCVLSPFTQLWNDVMGCSNTQTTHWHVRAAFIGNPCVLILQETMCVSLTGNAINYLGHLSLPEHIVSRHITFNRVFHAIILVWHEGERTHAACMHSKSKNGQQAKHYS